MNYEKPDPPRWTLMRRSGVAICLIAHHLEWEPCTIIQVGIGQYHKEVEVMHEVWPNAKFIGFEAHPDIAIEVTKPVFDDEDRLIQEPYPGRVINKAVADYVGTSELFVKKNHKDGCSLYGVIEQQNRDEYSSLQVEVTTLQEHLKWEPCKRPILLWLDCEGGEAAVLRGSYPFIDCVDVVNVEMTAKPLGPKWCTPSEVDALLCEDGFFQQWVHTQRSSAGQYDAIYVQKRLFRPEYCCNVREVNRWMAIQ